MTLTAFLLIHNEKHKGRVLSASSGNTYYVSKDSCASDDKNGLYADCSQGGNNGPFQTIQKGADTAVAGDIVKTLPGIYRETVTIQNYGSENSKITFEAANGADTVFIYGSENSSSFSWTNEGNGIYSTDISSLPNTPELIYEKYGSKIIKYPKAHEPDWDWNASKNIYWTAKDREEECSLHYDQEDWCWKYHKDWWTASSGSLYSLTDSNENQLKQFSNLQGSVVYMLDTKEAFYSYRREVTSYSPETDTIGWDESADFDYKTGISGIGPFSKYYIEGNAAFLDNPTEWYIEDNTLYLRPRTQTSPANLDIEIATRGIGIDVSCKPYITLKNLNIYFINNLLNKDGSDPKEGPITFRNTSLEPRHSSFLTIDGVKVAHSGKGIRFIQGGVDNDKRSEHITIQNSEIYDIEGYAYVDRAWNFSEGVDGGFPNLHFKNNHVHSAGFKAVDWGGYGVKFTDVYKLVVEGNYFHDIAAKAITMSNTRGEYILIKDNLIERAGLNLAEGAAGMRRTSTTDSPKILWMGNVIKDTHAWTFPSWEAYLGNNTDGVRWYKGESGAGIGTEVVNSGGVFYAPAAFFYRNLLINNSWSGISSKGFFFNNTFVRNPHYGLAIGHYWENGTDVAKGSLVKNNIFLDSYWGLSIHPSDPSCVNINYNLYEQAQEIRDNPISIWMPAGHFIHDIPGIDYPDKVYGRVCDASDQDTKDYSICYIAIYDCENPPCEEPEPPCDNTSWEKNGVENEGVPILYNQNGSTIDPNYEPIETINRFKADFYLVPDSKAIDAGTEPTEILTLINDMEQVLGITIEDQNMYGSGYDIGALEYQGTTPLYYDLNNDTIVDSKDLRILLQSWSLGYTQGDFNSDGVVNLIDFGILSNNLDT